MDIGEHLRAAYGIEVTATTQLDLGVHRIHRKGGGDWVARVYPATRGRRAVEDDARVLRLLERGDFPAERCATAEPVSVRGDEAVLVTTFVDGARARQDGSTFAWLGGLLGALNAKSADNLHAGGGWHHLTPSGTPADEQSAALDALAGMSSKGADVAAFDRLCEMVDDVDTGADLPHCLVHPDFVPANVITPPGGGAPVVIDWANAGRGCGASAICCGRPASEASAWSTRSLPATRATAPWKTPSGTGWPTSCPAAPSCSTSGGSSTAKQPPPKLCARQATAEGSPPASPTARVSPRKPTDADSTRVGTSSRSTQLESARVNVNGQSRA